MPSVASQAVHSIHHGHAAHARSPASDDKEQAPETPFAQLLDDLGQPAGPTDDKGQRESAAPAGRPTETSSRTTAPKSDSDRSGRAKADDARDAGSSNGETGAGQTDDAGAAGAGISTDHASIDAAIDATSDASNGEDESAAPPAADHAASDPTVQPRGLDIAAAVAAVVPPVRVQDRPASTLPKTASDVAVLATGKTAAWDPGKAAAHNSAIEAHDPLAPVTSGAEGEGGTLSAAIDTSRPSELPSNTAAMEATAGTAAVAEAKQGQAQAKEKTESDPDGGDAAPEMDAAEAGASAQVDPAAGRKLGEIRGSGEQPSAKSEHHAHFAATGQPGDTALAASNFTAGSDPGSAANTAPADGIPSAPGPTGDRVANAAAQTAGPPANPTLVSIPIVGLAVEIAARAQAGSHRFEIRLDPPELGRVEVRLDVDKSGHVNSHLIVDRPDTLDLLRRDAGDLQRALQQAGLTTTDDALQFSLRDQSFAGFGNGNGDPSNTARLIVSDPELNPAETVATGYGRMLPSGGGIDIRV